MSESIIKQLKANEKPFGLMSEEMRYAIREIPIKYLQVYEIGHWLDLTQPLDRTQDVLRYTYRLRADYTEQPEIVEKEIYADGNEYYFEDEGSNVPITSAPASIHFIGYKFADGTVMGTPVKYSVPGITTKGYFATYEDIVTGQALEHHAIIVLFRGQE